jgi:hypothetical protein
MVNESKDYYDYYNDHCKDIYCIKVQGLLDSKWVDWFNGLKIEQAGVDETTLTGPITDQSALHGILATIRDLGLTLISVQRIERNN